MNIKNENIFAKNISKKVFAIFVMTKGIKRKKMRMFSSKKFQKVFALFVYPNDENSKNGGNFYVK